MKKEGVLSKIILPQAINGKEKTDWNDVHKIEGLIHVQKQLGLENENIVLHELHNNLSKNKSSELEISIDNFGKKAIETKKKLHETIPGEDGLKQAYNNICQAKKDDSKPRESSKVNQKVRNQIEYDLEI